MGPPLEVYVILPPAPSSGTDGSYPLIVQSHGWGNSAGGPGNTEFFGPTADAWALSGYAVVQLTARGFGDSCGSSASRVADPTGCASGYIRLDDERYEVRDVQNAIGLLVDEGVVDPARIGVTGESYGGGVSLELATLKDRMMNADGSLIPWKSPAGTPLSIAAAAPVIPWSDLVYSLVPNGRTLDYQVADPTTDLSPAGVEKQSFVSGLFATGARSGFYAPPGVDPQADLTSWYAAINAGEPHRRNPEISTLIQQIAQFHSSYLLDGAYRTAQEAPAPLLIANGFTDDLFPVDEALRYYNLEHSLHPSDPISLFDGDFGHMRAQNKAGDEALLSSEIQAFFDHYLKGAGAQPQPSATATIETCPSTAPSGGPFTAATWAALHPGEVDYSSSPSQTISSGAGDPTIARAIDPIAGDGACASVSGTDQERRRHLPPPCRQRLRVHAARLADGDRQPQCQRSLPVHRRALVGRRSQGQHRDARRPRHLPARLERARRRAGLPAAPRRVALRGRARAQARAARPGLPVRAHVQRAVLDHRLRPPAAPARARATWKLIGRELPRARRSSPSPMPRRRVSRARPRRSTRAACTPRAGCWSQPAPPASGRAHTPAPRRSVATACSGCP